MRKFYKKHFSIYVNAKRVVSDLTSSHLWLTILSTGLLLGHRLSEGTWAYVILALAGLKEVNEAKEAFFNGRTNESTVTADTTESVNPKSE